MNSSPVISIIVPVCNVEPYLPACLNSLVNQTLQDIEIICVNDCSRDHCGEILAQYAAKDSRIHVVTYEINKTAAQARKDGVLMAHGRYIMFIDGDDMLETGACEKLAALMDEKQVDMLQFATNILAEEGMDPHRKAHMQRMLAPYPGTLRSDCLMELCFVKKRFGYQLWNKIYRSDVCRQAFSCFPDGRFSKAQDLFAFFLIAFFARTYEGYAEEAFYIYRFGVGVTGRAVVDRARIDRYADQALVPSGIAAFLNAHDALETCRTSLDSVTQELFADSMTQLTRHVAETDAAYAFQKMCEGWGTSKVIAYLAEQETFQPDKWASLLNGWNDQQAARPVRRIGTYYHTMANGGAQRVMAELAKLWVKMGYEVVIFTDQAPTAMDYAVPSSIKRIALPDFAQNAGAHIAALGENVRDIGIDMFVYHGWLDTYLFWDMLAVQAAGARFYIHTHSVFSAPLLTDSQKKRMPSMQNVFAAADGVLTLSRADEAYWRCFNPNVFVVKNPLTFDCRSLPVHELAGNTILWVGRISKEKQPLDAVEIFARVAQRVPDAKLRMVGSGNARLTAQVQKRCAQLGIADRVELCGYHADLAPCYAAADVLLSTSQYEGYPLTMVEAQSYGLPIVAYEMPFLTILETGAGSISVRHGDTLAAADALIQLLTDRNALASAGREAKANVIAQCTTDFEAMWRGIIASAEVARQTEIRDPYAAVMLRTLLQHVETGALGGIRHGTQDGTFVPMPTRGPFKRLRKKARTALQVMTRDGVAGFKEVLAEKLLFHR